MTRGDGCLLWATRSGTRQARVSARPVRRVAPALWPRYCAEAWVASWIRLCENELVGRREILERPEWAARVRWRDHRGTYETVLRPDLLGVLDDDEKIAIQFELTRTSPARRRVSLQQHANWIDFGQSIQLLYVCAHPESREMVREEAAAAGLSEERGTIRVELASAIQQQALKLFREQRGQEPAD